jgi:2-phospho-L-lactate guanylyltransferase
MTATRIGIAKPYAALPVVGAAVLVPVKAFREAKRRLAGALDASERARLARAMAGTVLRAAGDLHVAVVCDDPGVREWARSMAAEVVWRPRRGLNGAVQDGVAHLSAAGYDRVIVAHADLPRATELAWVGDHDGVTLVPDRRGDGTNVCCVPAAAGFRFSYGAGSFARHRSEAHRLGLAVRVVEDDALGWDVDVPADLVYPEPPTS